MAFNQIMTDYMNYCVCFLLYKKKIQQSAFNLYVNISIWKMLLKSLYL